MDGRNALPRETDVLIAEPLELPIPRGLAGPATAPNQVWVTDITFLWTQQGWLYLAAILDLFSRRVVGWATSANVDRHLALTALDHALRARRPSHGLVHHSDRGSTYPTQAPITGVRSRLTTSNAA